MTTTETATRVLVADALRRDPRLETARQLILSVVAENQQSIDSIQEPLPELIDGYRQMLDQFGELRGGNLYFPFLGSGIGNGPFVELADGSVKLDLITGIGVHGYGHSHPLMIRAGLDAAIGDTVMQGNLQQNTNSCELTKLLVETARESGAGLNHCFLSTSGAMANENSLKMAFQKNHPANRVIAFADCFAGRTLALAQITDKSKYRVGLPDTITVDYLPFFQHDQPEASIAASVDQFKQHLKRHPKQYAALWLELIQGEGGYYEGRRDFFEALIEVARDNDVAVIADEVQTFCRTTRAFAFQHYRLDKLVDIVNIGKISQVCATLFTDAYVPQPGLISQTFTSSTFCIVAAQAIIEGLIANGNFGPEGKNQKMHDYFVAGLKKIAVKYPNSISGPFGIGGMIAFTPGDGSADAAQTMVNSLYHAGLMSFMAGGDPSRVRFLLPLGCIEQSHLDLACQIIESVVATHFPC